MGISFSRRLLRRNSGEHGEAAGKKEKIHWGIFIETLAKTKAKPGQSVLESLFKGIKRQSGAEEIWAAHSWDNLDSRFASIRTSTAGQKYKAASERRSSLLEKFHFLNSHRLREQAERVLKHLLFLYPHEPDFRDMKYNFDEERAREIISHHFSSNVAPAEMTVPELTKEEEALVRTWIAAGAKITAKHPEAAYDLAIGLQFMDADEASLHFARMAQNGLSAGVGPDWLAAELMLKLKRYVELLELLEHLEIKYGDDPETAFAAAYLRAQALKALGESATAVEILRSIVHVRPNYRSVGHLMKEWNVGAAAV